MNFEQEFSLWESLGETSLEVMLALIPLLLFFILFKIFYLHIKKDQLLSLLMGVGLTFLGIVLFLQGVNAVYLPVGEMMGAKFVQLEYTWALIPVGLLLGVVATLAEPSVKVLVKQVDEVTSGSIPQSIMMGALAIGVGTAIALSMTRLILQISVSYLIITGYLLVLLLMKFSKERFVAIAFDAGGVATGPMTVTFLMAFSLGVTEQIGVDNEMTEGFGMIALVALAPIMSVLILGLLLSGKEKQIEYELEREIQNDSYHSQKGKSQKNSESNQRSRRRRRYHYSWKRHKRGSL